MIFDRKDPIMKPCLAAVIVGVSLLGAPASPASAHPRFKCSELRAMVSSAWAATPPGRATGCRRMRGTRYFVQGRRWWALLTVMRADYCPPRSRACYLATDVAYHEQR